jgi:hypothetical protein
MRELRLNLSGLLLLPALLFSSWGFSQVAKRPHHNPINLQKTETVTAEIPCAGSLLLSEDFENGIPLTWTVIDGDTLTPMSQMNLQKGWQGHQDYRDTSNLLAVSPSWYVQTGKSDDWLITPAVTLGSNPCLSWWVYSQDIYFKEAYEVLVSTTLDTAAFHASPAVETVAEESGVPHTATASLATWAGQTVYIAFHQTSDDKFVLALDDVKVTNVNAVDIGVYAFTYGSPEPGDSVVLRFQVANYGSDTVTSFQALYSVEGGPAEFMTVGAVSIPPNGVLFFNHDSTFVSDSLDAIYDFCAWTTLPNTILDQELQNDTLCSSFSVGSPVGSLDPSVATTQLALYPNPCQDQLTVLLKGTRGSSQVVTRIMDLRGAVLWTREETLAAGAAVQIPTADLLPGMYFVSITPRGKSAEIQKFIKL